MDDLGNIILDQDLFVQTSDLFARKQDTLSPEILQDLARSVITRAAGLAASQDATAPYTAPPDRLTAFCEHLLANDPDAGLALIQQERRDGLSARDVYFGYISAAAQHFGRLWQDDAVSFTQVTSASGYLYAMMRALRPVRPDTAPGPDTRKHALFANVPGEDHGIGVSMAADLFARQGWDIDLKLGLEHAELVDRIAATRPDIVGLSLSTPERLVALTRLCVSIRLAVPPTLIAVAGPGAADAGRVRQVADVDFVFTDVDEAQAQLARLMHMRGRD